VDLLGILRSGGVKLKNQRLDLLNTNKRILLAGNPFITKAIRFPFFRKFMKLSFVKIEPIPSADKFSKLESALASDGDSIFSHFHVLLMVNRRYFVP
jgi:hypothetical protein